MGSVRLFVVVCAIALSSAQYVEGWSAVYPGYGKWMQLDLQAVQLVAGVITQSRAFSTDSQHVTQNTVQVSTDEVNWIPVDSAFIFQENQPYTPEEDCVENQF
jgi:hypothetical protein